MKLGIKTCLRWIAGLIAGALVVSMVYPRRGEAASPEVDVCHSEGNGSFHLITVAYQAIQAHRDHGDALPGEAVPGQSGFTFSDTCTLVAVSICPCDFSLAALAAIGIGGDAQASPCFEDSAALVALAQVFPVGSFAVATKGGGGCVSVGHGVQVDAFFDVSPAQATACGNDLRAASVAFGATSSSKCSF